MVSESMEPPRHNEYDRRRRWTRVIGEVVGRCLARGDDDVLVLRAPIMGAAEQAERVLMSAVEDETLSSLERATKFFSALDAGAMPVAVKETIRGSEPELRRYIAEWSVKNESAINDFREATHLLKGLKLALPDDRLIAYCLKVREAEESLVDYIQLRLTANPE